MKKQIYLTVCMMMVMTTILFAQTDTISGWNFSDTTNASMNANMGLTGNLGYNIRPEDTAGAVRTAYYLAAGIDFAAAAQGWDNGADNKFWSVRFKADGYGSFRISSVQSSDPGNPGPKYWKVQARKSGGVWADVVGATSLLVPIGPPESFNHFRCQRFSTIRVPPPALCVGSWIPTKPPMATL
jgi:hypothetical protein